MMMQSGVKEKLYHSAWGCLTHILKKDGMAGLYKGNEPPSFLLKIYISMTIPHSMTLPSDFFTLILPSLSRTVSA